MGSSTLPSGSQTENSTSLSGLRTMRLAAPIAFAVSRVNVEDYPTGSKLTLLCSTLVAGLGTRLLRGCSSMLRTAIGAQQGQRWRQSRTPCFAVPCPAGPCRVRHAGSRHLPGRGLSRRTC